MFVFNLLLLLLLFTLSPVTLLFLPLSSSVVPFFSLSLPYHPSFLFSTQSHHPPVSVTSHNTFFPFTFTQPVFPPAPPPFFFFLGGGSFSLSVTPIPTSSLLSLTLSLPFYLYPPPNPPLVFFSVSLFHYPSFCSFILTLSFPLSPVYYPFLPLPPPPHHPRPLFKFVIPPTSHPPSNPPQSFFRVSRSDNKVQTKFMSSCVVHELSGTEDVCEIRWHKLITLSQLLIL